MANEFINAKTQIASVIAAVSGIHQAPTNPNETQNDFPFASIYLSTGNLGAGAEGTRKSLYNIVIDVLTNRIDLAHDLAIIDPFIDSIPAALIAQVSNISGGPGARFGNTISTFDEITMQFLPDANYAGVPCIGYRFIMSNVKILSNT
jgi:hypothetical protein